MDTSLIPDLLILGWGLFNLFLLLVEKHSAGSKNEARGWKQKISLWGSGTTIHYFLLFYSCQA